jgi:hypothetical protein
MECDTETLSDLPLLIFSPPFSVSSVTWHIGWLQDKEIYVAFYIFVIYIYIAYKMDLKAIEWDGVDWSHLSFFFYWCSGGGVQLGPLGTAAANKPIVPIPGIMMIEKLLE